MVMLKIKTKLENVITGQSLSLPLCAMDWIVSFSHTSKIVATFKLLGWITNANFLF